MVGDDYFDVNEEEAGRRSKWENDRQYGRVIADVSFRPLKHNPNAKEQDAKISKAAVYKLRHTTPRDFINGVAMDIGSFMDRRRTRVEKRKKIQSR